MSALRSASNRFPPKYTCRKAAWLERGKYLCAGYQRKPHPIPASIKVNGKRKNNVAVDHISPVIDPIKGFVSWDQVVERMFVTQDKMQVLCSECHQNKSNDERKQRKKK